MSVFPPLSSLHFGCDRVQKWKAFASEVEGMTKALKKKDNSGALVAYKKALVALDEYLDKVELSSK
jgi:hypothetical protein